MPSEEIPEPRPERRHSKVSALRSIRGKLFWLRIGIGLTMSFSIGIFCYFIIASAMQDIRQNALEQDISSIVDLLRRQVADHKKAAEEIAKDNQIHKFFNNYSLNLVQDYFQKHTHPFDSVGLIDEDGAMSFNIVYGKPQLAEVSIKDDPDYVKAVQTKPGETVMSQPRLINYLHNSGLLFDYQDKDFFDKRLSFVRGAISLARFGEIIAKATTENVDNIYIVTKSGTLIYSSILTDVPGQDISQANAELKALWAEDRSFGDLSADGNYHKFEREVIPELEWTVLVTADLKVWNKPIVKLRNQIILFCLLALVLGEIFSRLVGLKITEPITRLNRLAQTIIHSGRLSDRVEWQSMDELGELAHSVNTMLDKVEESHDQLQGEKQFVDNVLASVVDGMAVCGADGHIVRTNDALPNLLGYEPSEFIGMPWTSILPASIKEDDERLIHLAENHFLRLDDTEVLMKNGTPLPVTCTISLIRNLAGQPDGFLVILTDIRDRKHLEQARVKAESRLRETQEELLKTEKMAVVGQMSGMVAHEVLNPISAVKVRIDLGLPKALELSKVLEVLDRIINDWRREADNGTFAAYFVASGQKDLTLLGKISDTLSKRQADRISDLEFLDRQIQRVIKIIDNLREMSRQEKTIEKIDLARLLSEVMDDLGDGIKKRRIEIRLDCRTNPSVMADYMEVYSIFSNLIKNGMQAIDKQPTEAERCITVLLEQANDQQASVEISDTGIGMDASQCEAVFSPGFTSKGRQGTGIGTSFARKLARQFGGDILITKSVPGQGTTFQVLLAVVK